MSGRRKRWIAAIGLVAIGGVAILMAMQTGGRRHSGESQALRGPIGIVAPSTDLDVPDPPTDFGAYMRPSPMERSALHPEGLDAGRVNATDKAWDPSPEECLRVTRLTSLNIFGRFAGQDAGVIDAGALLLEKKKACFRNMMQGMRLPGVRWAEDPR